MKKLIFISFVLLFPFCSTYTLTGIKGKNATYTIKAGKHEMKGGRVLMLKDNEYNFVVLTDSSWVWDVPAQNGFSKVTGIGWIGMDAKNSARLVYINKPNNVHEFWAYFYVAGVSPQVDPKLKKKLIDVEIGKSYYGTIRYSNGWYTVIVGDKHHSVRAQAKTLPYLMFPYIGGTYTIGHDWKVQLTYY